MICNCRCKTQRSYQSVTTATDQYLRYWSVRVRLLPIQTSTCTNKQHWYNIHLIDYHISFFSISAYSNFQNLSRLCFRLRSLLFAWSSVCPRASFDWKGLVHLLTSDSNRAILCAAAPIFLPTTLAVAPSKMAYKPNKWPNKVAYHSPLL